MKKLLTVLVLMLSISTIQVQAQNQEIKIDVTNEINSMAPFEVDFSVFNIKKPIVFFWQGLASGDWPIPEWQLMYIMNSQLQDTIIMTKYLNWKGAPNFPDDAYSVSFFLSTPSVSTETPLWILFTGADTTTAAYFYQGK